MCVQVVSCSSPSRHNAQQARCASEGVCRFVLTQAKAQQNTSLFSRIGFVQARTLSFGLDLSQFQTKQNSQLVIHPSDLTT